MDLDLKIRSRDINTLIEMIRVNNPEVDMNLVKKAYDYAFKVHEKQKRLSGEPYIVHPLEVAIIIANLKLDSASIAAALLHDVVEDTNTTIEFIAQEFGEDVALLVDGVTKISYIKNRSKSSAQAETLRKMLMATINDVRVIVIKLADKLHNMRTIIFQPVHKQYRIAKETLDIYAPIGRRLGMSKISSELEDLSFFVLYFEEYNEIKRAMTQRRNDIEGNIELVKSVLLKKFAELKVNADIRGRAKHYFSIFRKMQTQGKTIDEIYDLRAIRIITDEVKDCYAILGTVHTLWSPLASRFKDYIAVPKSNMYQSLHTTVIGPEGHPLEVQIRTKEMHAVAEMGIAAHWIYKDGKPVRSKNYLDMSLLQNIDEWYNEYSAKDFVSNLKMDLYEDEIFVFTPQGKIIKLSNEATPIDFAYAIHTEVGNKMTGAKVNNRLVPLKTNLKSGDIVEIMTSSKAHPSREWIKIVKSSNAKNKIRSWFRKNYGDEKSDEKSDEKIKKHKDEKTAEVIIPENEQIKLKKLSKTGKSGVSIEGTGNILIKLSQCCQPIPGDDVVGFITRGRGITIHKKNCPSLKGLSNESERIIRIVWEENEKNLFPVKISVTGTDRGNLLKDIAEIISSRKSNIIKAEANVSKDIAEFKFVIEVKSNSHLKEIISSIKNIKSINDVYKINEKVVIK